MNNGDPWNRVTVLLVTYNSAAVIGACLESLRSVPNVVVVDNASDDNTLAIVRATHPPNARIVANASNLGLSRAVNCGFASAQTEYGLLLNPDAVVDRVDLTKLVTVADANANAAAVVPILVNGRGHPELSVMGPFEHNHRPADILPDGDFCTWFVTGAVMLIRLAAWRALEGFDESIFLYGEDSDFGLRATRAGYSLIVVPEARAVHLGGQSSRVTWRTRWRRDWHMTWGHLYLERKHGNAARVSREARALALRFALKSALYVLLLNPKRVLGNLAKAAAAVAFLSSARIH